MALTWKDGVATALTAAIVVVALIVDGHRWAAAVVLGLGVLSCALGSAAKAELPKLPGLLGAAALVLAVLAIVTGWSIALALLVLDDVLLWAVTTLRHATRPAIARS